MSLLRSLLLVAILLMPQGGCSLWPDVRDNVVDCAKEAARDVWSVEIAHLKEMIEAGVSYDSVASYAVGLGLRFGKPFVVCLWQRIKAQGDTFASGVAQERAALYANRWLAENP